LDLIVSYISKKIGKRIRPTLVFLSAEICGGVSERTFIGATLVELLHTATLIHDDVVDASSIRRGMASINAVWNNKIAVLVGDYLLGKGLLTAIDAGEFAFLQTSSNAVRRMSEGELLQIQKSNEYDLDEETYFRIISDKTASLMSSCCEIGAISATDAKEKQEAMRVYGESIGIAFQIRDDIFDYVGNSVAIGKPVGNDLKEKKITLPLINALSKADRSTSKEIIKMIKSGKISKSDIKKVVEFVKSRGGLEYAELKALEYRTSALKALDIFEDSEAKRSLINLTDYIIRREM
jgi:octaprenyl-diphosphate synthase